MSTILSSAENFNVDNIVFSEPQEITIPDSEMTFKRINIQTKFEDGSQGDLVLKTTRLFSFGVSEETSRETGKVSGYKMPLCMWNRDGPSKEEKMFTDLLESISEKCASHVLEHKDDLEKYDMEKSDLRKINSALYWKMEKGKRVEGQGPTLYAKLVHYKKDDKFGTVFFSPVDGTEIDPKSIIGTRCDVKAAIKIDNIYVGRDVRLQIKILEGAVEPRSTGKKQWLARPTASKILEPTSDSTSSGLMGVNNDNDDDAGSLAASSDEEEEEVKPVEKPKPAPKKKKIIKRRVAKR